MNNWSEDNIRDKNTGEIIKEVIDRTDTYSDRQSAEIKDMQERTKQQIKITRQHTKLACLEAALRHTSKTDGVKSEEVVTAAKAFYAFVRI